jgi:uncharacterized protein DUF4389
MRPLLADTAVSGSRQAYHDAPRDQPGDDCEYGTWDDKVFRVDHRSPGDSPIFERERSDRVREHAEAGTRPADVTVLTADESGPLAVGDRIAAILRGRAPDLNRTASGQVPDRRRPMSLGDRDLRPRTSPRTRPSVRAREMVIMASVAPYPVRVDAALQPRLSRWLWLVKWFLAIPHFVVLAFLWIAFGVLSVVAFLSILFTGRYPRSIFDFNVGVLRWNWRVAYYSYGAFGTDQYPPFTLADVPEYPAHFDVSYPERLSRGLVLVKWWLLAIPHYLIAALFIGGGSWLGWEIHHTKINWIGGGLVSILALVAIIVVAATGSYPRPLFDVILGMDRWVLRVAGYVGLMTDTYPPFRLDLGGPEPGSTLTLPPRDPAGAPGAANPTPQPDPTTSAATRWTAGRVVSVVAGAVVAVASFGALAGGAGLLWADQTQRHDGYLTSPATNVHTNGYAVASTQLDMVAPASWLGDVRIRVTPDRLSQPVFIGIAPADRASQYLAGMSYSTVIDLSGRATTYIVHEGAAPRLAPTSTDIWVAEASGTGAQTLTWPVENGRWTVVLMNADASPVVSAEADAGVTVPSLPWFALGLLVGGVLLAVAAVALLAIPIRVARNG